MLVLLGFCPSGRSAAVDGFEDELDEDSDDGLDEDSEDEVAEDDLDEDEMNEDKHRSSSCRPQPFYIASSSPIHNLAKTAFASDFLRNIKLGVPHALAHEERPESQIYDDPLSPDASPTSHARHVSFWTDAVHSTDATVLNSNNTAAATLNPIDSNLDNPESLSASINPRAAFHNPRSNLNAALLKLPIPTLLAAIRLDSDASPIKATEFEPGRVWRGGRFAVLDDE